MTKASGLANKRITVKIIYKIKNIIMENAEFPLSGLFLDENNCLIEFRTHYGKLIQRRLGAHKKNEFIKCYFNVGSGHENIFMRCQDQMLPHDIFLRRPYNKKECFYLLDDYLLIGKDDKVSTYVDLNNAELVDSKTGKITRVSIGVWMFDAVKAEFGILETRKSGYSGERHYFAVDNDTLSEINEKKVDEIILKHQAQIPEGWQQLQNLPDAGRLL